ncbi:TIGR04372 family glycosyltransferase [Lusitaniella coriacea LEGE 07157]|uniref:TIGR04372 family glycosyltransferase n=1 Tax=Lusitaniella coriacea LEGE 07157 TaxID=945747 RepID=A0A8J7JBI3_9CYAN|nr:TIGR04372 family glycosyltransferase [Lusitaniella coriacea]MBE9116865.1 TIGR04372 family glycosyltransferase [Lusitaniella coriacea LEGE 07157]
MVVFTPDKNSSWEQVQALVKLRFKNAPILPRVLRLLKKVFFYLAYYLFSVLRPVSQEEQNQSSEALAVAYLERGNTLILQNSVGEALENYNQAIALKPDWGAAYYYRGNAFSSKGDLDDALQDYNSAIALGLDWGDLYVNMGNALTGQGKMEEAIESYKGAIARQSDSAETYFYYGNALLSLQQYDRAVEIYEKVLALNPNLHGFRFNFATALTYQGKLEEAVEYYRKELSCRPDFAQGYHFLGNTLDRMNRLEEAKTAWGKAMALKPGDMVLYNDLAIRLMFRGDRAQMIDVLQQGYQEQAQKAKEKKLSQINVRCLSSTWSSVIGHIGLLDYYVKMGLLDRQTHRHTILLTPPNQIVNSCLLDYWKSYIDVVSEPAVIQQLSFLKDCSEDVLAGVTFSDGRTLPYFEAWAIIQKQWEAENRHPLLSLSESHRERGWQALETLGVPRDAWFVCLHVREPGFHKDSKGLYQTFRNANIDTYSLAIQTIVERGGWVIRVGDPSMKPLPPQPQVIDYAHSSIKSDWMDVFLCGACRFYIGTTSGLSHVPPTFGVPCAITNWTPMGIRSAYSADVLLPKLYWSEPEQRYLSFAEVIDPSIGYIQYAPFLIEKGIKPVDNTLEEINALVVEMLERLEGSIEYTEEDICLQEQLDRISSQYTSYPSRLGRNFLQKYRDLLD